MKTTLSCETCKHFLQHFMRVDNDYYKIPCGHCGNGRVPREYARLCIREEKACTLYESKDNEKK